MNARGNDSVDALVRQLIIASYIYQDGEAFVRASLAMDAIVQALIERRNVAPGENRNIQQAISHLN